MAYQIVYILFLFRISQKLPNNPFEVEDNEAFEDKDT